MIQINYRNSENYFVKSPELTKNASHTIFQSSLTTRVSGTVPATYLIVIREAPDRDDMFMAVGRILICFRLVCLFNLKHTK